MTPDPDLLRAALRPLSPHGLSQVQILTAHPGSGLSRLGDAPPYWAWVWAGGATLARHVLDHPWVVAGRRVLDFGAGSGVVGIAAAKAGAAQVLAIEADPWGRCVIGLNAALNGAEVAVAATLPAVLSPGGVVLAGDVFYAPEVAARALPLLDRCLAAGLTVLVGDPGRADLPLHRLTPLASYPVRDMGDAPATPLCTGTVYRLNATR